MSGTIRERGHPPGKTQYVPADNGLRELEASRTIENPGGMAFVANGSLIVVEGAVESGNGKMLEILLIRRLAVYVKYGVSPGLCHGPLGLSRCR